MRLCHNLTVAEVADCAFKHSKSSNMEDVMLLPLLMQAWRSRTAKGHEHQRRGSFVELGAFDGIIASNTYMLEKCCGWSGTLIEANPANFAQLQQSGRTGAMVHSAVCTQPGSIQMSSAGGVFATTGTGKFASSRKDILRGGTTSVPCDTLTSLLDAHARHPSHIAFFSLDVEGAEEIVLNATDVSRFDVVLFEKFNMPIPVLNRVKARLVSVGGLVDMSFETHVRNSACFVRPELVPLAATARDRWFSAGVRWIGGGTSTAMRSPPNAAKLRKALQWAGEARGTRNETEFT